jgi:multiple sugar transport system ATP-binding protein
MSALVLKNLTKVYENGAVALKNLSLEVAEGELLVILGPSGSGKSTALRLIAGLDNPTGGEILIGGKRADCVPPRDRDIAMVFQDYALYPHMNVAQNLSFGLKMRRFPKPEIETRVMETAAMLGIADLLDRKPRELSGGQRQRVALGRALVRKPKVFLFDEPLSNVDPTLRVQLRQEIKQIHDALAVTMVYVTHDQHEAMLIGRRIAVLRAGLLEQVGAPSELYLKPVNAFVASFLGTPSINFIECPAVKGNGCIEIKCGESRRLRLPWDAGRPLPSLLRVGFRPEDVTLGHSGGNQALSGAARILSVEAMGGETVIQLEDGELRFCARALGFLNLTPGASVPYAIPREKLRLFEGESGRRLDGEPEITVG